MRGRMIKCIDDKCSTRNGAAQERLLNELDYSFAWSQNDVAGILIVIRMESSIFYAETSVKNDMGKHELHMLW